MLKLKQIISINNLSKKLTLLLGALICLLFCQQAKSQVYTATVKIDTTKILVGEQAIVTLDVRIPVETINDKSQFLKWHSIKDTISQNIEIVNASEIDTTLSTDKKTYLLTQQLTITSFDSGFFVIPPFRFLRNGDSLKYIETQALLLEVITFPVDTTQAIKDIKPPLEAPFTLSEILPRIIAGVVLIALIALIIYLVIKRKNKPIYIPEKTISIPPHQVALNKLEELKAKKLWQEGKSKEYHTELTEIIRTYIEERFKIMALEQTTDEIIQSFRSVDIKDESKTKLKQMLALADFVKFAKIHPLPAENELSLSNAFDFINSTIPKIVIAEQENKGGEA